MKRKGQSAVELTMVIGIFLVLASPFILASQSSILDLSRSSEYLQLDKSMDRVESTSKFLQKKSFPARRNLNFDTPRNVVSAYNPKFDGGSALVFETELEGSKTNYSIVLDFNLEVVEWGNITREGVHEISLKRATDAVNMSVIS